MHNDSRRLIAAVERSVDHKLDVEVFNDRLTMQKGCYILNSWGYGPKYKFSLYIRGPYSRDLANDYYKIGKLDNTDTDVPEEAITRLKEIFDKGIGYAEAYATVLLVKNNSPGASYDSIYKRSLELKPNLTKEVEEASALLLT